MPKKTSKRNHFVSVLLRLPRPLMEQVEIELVNQRNQLGILRNRTALLTRLVWLGLAALRRADSPPPPPLGSPAVDKSNGVGARRGTDS